jgi:ABC-type multidrug transport system fused ATPase/permease subunit
MLLSSLNELTMLLHDECYLLRVDVNIRLSHLSPIGFCSAVPRLMGRLMDPVSSKVESKNSHSFISSILWLGLVGGSASFIRTVMLNQAQDHIAARLRREAFNSLMTQRELEWFHMEGGTQKTEGEQPETEDKGTPALKQTSETTVAPATGMTPAAIGVILKEDVDAVAHTVTATLANLLRSTSSCVFGTYHMLCLNPSLVGLSLAVAPVVGTLAWLTRNYLKKVLAIQQQAALNAASFLEERLNHILLVKMSNREEDEVEIYSQIQNEYVDLGRRSAMANGLSMGTMFSLSTTALCGILLAGGKAVEAKRMNHGQLVSFGTYSFMLALGSAGIVKALGDYMKGMQCAVRLYRLIHVNVTDDEKEPDRALESASEGAKHLSLDIKSVQQITLENVFFTYKCDPSTVVLRNVSLSISRGEVVVIAGENGSGKSTLASLLVGLYSPASGNIFVHSTFSGDELTTDVVDYSNDLDRNDQSKLVQLVPQDPALLNTTIIENVRYSRPEASDEDVSRAMKAANCDRFVSRLEGGMQYQVGRNGARLSGGQRQRLGLARALLADPVFLVLDEPASSLDSEGETAVTDAIEACRASNRALLVITHRAKTLDLADRVVVLKEGAVVEEGPLSELQKNKEGELCALMPDLI